MKRFYCKKRNDLKDDHQKNREKNSNLGMTTVEVILIVVVLVGLVLIFKTQIQQLVQTIFEKIAEDSASVLA